jgi:hypothetical protein
MEKISVPYWDTLAAERLERITRANAAVVWLRKHDGIARWRETGDGANELQTAAMEAAHTNRPVGKGYNAAWKELAAHVPDLRDLHSTTRTHAMWLATEWEAINAWLDTLTHEQRWRLNHPTAIRRRWDAAHNVAREGTGQGNSYKARVSELENENHALREQLKRSDDGSLFNLEKDTGEEIGRVIANTVGEHKAMKIAQTITATVKTKKARRAHAG